MRVATPTGGWTTNCLIAAVEEATLAVESFEPAQVTLECREALVGRCGESSVEWVEWRLEEAAGAAGAGFRRG